MKASIPFTYSGQPSGLTLLDFWEFQFGNIFDLQEHIAEFLVAKALGMDVAFNRSGWTKWDIQYGDIKIEVKETGYYYSWQERHNGGKVSKRRTFGINGAYSDTPDHEFKRQSDIYVFCLNTGEDAEDSNPLELDHWQFYVVPTKKLNHECPLPQKTVSLGKVVQMAGKMVRFDELKAEVDNAIETINYNHNHF